MESYYGRYDCADLEKPVCIEERWISMSNQSKSRKGLLVGIIAAVVVLVAVLGLVLARCSGEQADTNVTTAATIVAEETERVDLYWNIDRKLYDGKSEAGMSSRCIPFEQEEITGTCVCCGKPAKHMLYWGKAY